MNFIRKKKNNYIQPLTNISTVNPRYSTTFWTKLYFADKTGWQ